MANGRKCSDSVTKKQHAMNHESDNELWLHCAFFQECLTNKSTGQRKRVLRQLEVRHTGESIQSEYR